MSSSSINYSVNYSFGTIFFQKRDNFSVTLFRLGGFPSNYPIEVLFLGHLIEREVLKRREDRLWVTGGRLRGKERSLLHPLKI